jgi:hypothetical protein
MKRREYKEALIESAKEILRTRYRVKVEDFDVAFDEEPEIYVGNGLVTFGNNPLIVFSLDGRDVFELTPELATEKGDVQMWFINVH